MIVISDTTPLNYLILIERENLLYELFGKVIIPQAVFDELSASGASEKVRRWVEKLPFWIEVRQTVLIPDASLDTLDAGEKEAILLAQELLADLLLVDDGQARLAATNLGIKITGTLGILDRAAQEKLINLPETLDALQKTSFHVSDDLIQKLLRDDAARK
jgi:predicted nucleic acid-binding protein